ncbi:DNA-3-methyladenine glycosylase family protein [Natrialbaceae archaeon AArc-T1-2]|uniref:DNA-3-methyladenine glycosylase family protein n=1 Tax=Natrialbaceae archaeon AArc-T1-2 TaxID=3053904 RepID=UPI00255A7F24|nr:DNA-3-methyladenine glycosylase 2 family protein [Natrialbaceae archaeon AArc-T1-2]WIV66337.1 DNA-3-methyladenine glycosylase 2 family protein [Natrialbaceae archaeon AArc-T1-2]
MGDPETVLRRDPVLAAVIDRLEPHPLEPFDCEYERLCVSIVNQQLSTASARAVRERVFDVLEGDVRPETVLAADDEALLEAGLSGQKLEYVRNAARAFRERDLTREGLADRSNAAVVDELTRIRGVGEWTARMYLIFVLERPDVLPLGDLAIRRGIEQLYNDGETLTRVEMRETAEPWRPYRSLGTRYVWAAYEADD